MSSTDRRPILVCGAPRSGTTWVGTVLSLPRGVRQVYEPFNLQIGMAGIPRQFLYVRAGGVHEPLARPLVDDLLAGRARLHASSVVSGGPLAQRLGRRLLGSRSNVDYQARAHLPGRRRWVLKDPIASLSAEWLHQQYAAPVAVTVRHPAAVVHSYRRLGWDIELAALWQQEELLADHDVRDLLLPRPGADAVTHVAQLWAGLYTVLGTYIDRNEGIVGVRHEDLSARPIDGFRSLYGEVGLPWTDGVESTVRSMTGAHNPSAPDRDRVHTLKRDSAADVGRWRSELTADEVMRVREIAGPVAARWYADQDW